MIAPLIAAEWETKCKTIMQNVKAMMPKNSQCDNNWFRVGGKEGMAGEMEPAEDMDQTEPDSTVSFK